MSLLVLQSCPESECEGWLQRCMTSVRHWCAQRGYEYRWLGDELFATLPEDLQPGGRISRVIASDLARLLWMQQLLDATEAVLWLDSDMLVFAPEALNLPLQHTAVGRELWVQADSNQWRVHRKVHNAALLFRRQSHGRNSTLDFYADTAQRLLRANQGGMPAQFIGPKLLTALHTVAQFPVMEDMGMFSPAVMRDLLGENNAALQAMLRRSRSPVHAANLCRSSVQQGALSCDQMNVVVDVLQQHCSSGLLA